jgi:anti-sigma factor ChrR (cupin superfamily)
MEMKMRKKTALASALMLAAGLMAVPFARAEPKRIAKGTAVLWPSGEIKWVPMPGGPPGALQSPLWGDATAGEHGMLYKWPAGTQVPVHTHSNGEHGSVVAGTLSLAVNGAPHKELPPGSYFSMAGATPHATHCKAGADCVFLIHREGAFDAALVGPTASR